MTNQDTTSIDELDKLLEKHQLEAGELTFALKQDLQAFIATQIQEAKQSITDEIGKIMEIQGANGAWNYDSYMHGMYNGMELCHALVKGVEPKYRDAPKQWLADIPMPKDAEPTQDIAQLRSTTNE